MNTVAIPKLDVKVWTYKSEFSQGTFLSSLTPPKITIKTPLELTDIEYDLINDGNLSMERVENNTADGINVMNVNDIEDFDNL